MNEDIMSTLKVLADKRMEMSLIRIRESDETYKKVINQVMELEKKYESLKLESETQEIVDKLLTARDEANMEQSSMAYLAGLEDCVLILRSIGMLQL